MPIGTRERFLDKKLFIIIVMVVFSSAFSLGIGIPPRCPVGLLPAFAEDNIFTDNVGIGTAAPAALTHLSSTAANDLFKIEDDGAGDTTPLVVDENGNLGIGTASTGTYKLWVNGDTYLGGLAVTNGAFTFGGDLEMNGYAIESSTGGLKFDPDDDGTNEVVMDTNGNVGIGSTAPLQKLHVEGQCVTGDTLLPILRKFEARSWKQEAGSKKLEVSSFQPPASSLQPLSSSLQLPASVQYLPITEVKPGDYVLSLNEETGKIEPHRINGLLDMGVKPVFKLTIEDGRSITTTGNHPYLVKQSLPDIAQRSVEDSGTSQVRQEIARKRLQEISHRHNLTPEDFSAAREFREPDFVWQDIGVRDSITDLTMVDVGNEDGVRLSKNKFNTVITGTQSKPFDLLTLEFDYFPVLQRMIKLTNLFNFSCNMQLFFNWQPSQFFLGGRVEEIIEHRDGYLEGFRRFLSRFSTFSPGIQEFAWSAAFIRASVSRTDSCEDNSIKSTISSNNSLERTLDGAITPRRFLSSIIVKPANLFIQIQDTIHNLLCQVRANSNFLAYASIPNYIQDANANWLKAIYLTEGDEIAVVNKLEAQSSKGIFSLPASSSNPSSFQLLTSSSQVGWDKIVSIKYVGYKQVYDIEVEGTHNFIANGIIAHNTYISGNVGIGTPAPNKSLVVSGANETNYAGGYPFNTSLMDTAAMAQDVGAGIAFGGNDGVTAGRWFSGFHGGKENGASGDYAGYLSFHTRVNGGAVTEKLRITSGGNVGIGSTAPLAKLDVAGAISATGTITGAGVTPGGNVTMGDDAWIGLGASAGRIVFDDAGTDGVNIMNGNVGIGTTAPAVNLDILGASGSNGAIRVAGDTTGTTAKLHLKDSGSNHAWEFAMDGTDSPSHPDMFSFAYYNGSYWSYPFTVLSAGNVGIGTAAPGAKLEVYGATDSKLFLQPAAIGNNPIIGARVDTGGYLGFGIRASLNPTSLGGNVEDVRMVINSNGNVGIGTTGPGEKLSVDVSSSQGDQGTVAIALGQEEASARKMKIVKDTSTPYNADIYWSYNPTVEVGDLSFYSSQDSGALVTFKSGGNVGIGTTVPYYGLDIYNGHISFKNATSQTDQGGDAKNMGIGWASAAQTNVLSNLITVDRNGNYGGDFKFYSRGAGGGSMPAALMTISTTGNVGIGTTAPSALLNVYSTSLFGAPSLTADTYNLFKIGTQLCPELAFGSYNASPYAMWMQTKTTSNNGASWPLAINPLGGNVGIGSTSPTAKLWVKGSGTTTGKAVSVTDSADSEKVTILDNGNVGIGTTVPTAHLYVGAGTPEETLGTNDAYISGDLEVDGTIFGAAISGAHDGTGTDNYLARWNAAGDDVENSGIVDNSASVAVTVDTNGNVGIGTTGPRAALEVVNTIFATIVRTSNTFTTDGGKNTLDGYEFNAGGMQAGWNTTSFNIKSRNNANIIITPHGTGNTMIAAGNVGIGSTVPLAKLDIAAGNLDIDSTTNANQYGIVSKDGSRFIHNFNYGDNGTVTTNGGNTFVGINAGNLTMGSTATQTYQASSNTAVGAGALYANTTGYGNTAVGTSAFGTNTTGYYNAALGDAALYLNATGYNNSAVGRMALGNNSTGYNNTAVGSSALASNTTGCHNTAVGAPALYANTTGYCNIALGEHSGRWIADGATGNTVSNNSVYLGYDSRALADGDTNEIVIGASATGSGSNSVTLGNTSITKTILQGNVGIGSTVPLAKLDVAGAINATGTITGAGITPGGNITMGDDAWIGLGASAGRIVFDDAGTDSVNIMNGNVGIGTTAPSARLELGNHVVAASASPETICLGGTYSSTPNANAKLRLYYDGTNTFGLGVSSAQLDYMVYATSADHVFYAGANEIMRVKGTGNVGIGTTSPSYPLHVYNSALSEITVDAPSAIQSRITWAKDGSRKWTLYSPNSSDDLIFYELNSGKTGARLTLQSSGNVGIGTTGPNGKIAIEGTANDATLAVRTGALLSISNTSNDLDFVIGQMAASPYTTWIQNRNNNATEAGYPIALNPLGGNLGIGTTSPTAKLWVKGSGTTTGKAVSVTDSADSEKVTILDNGNVGIGTTAPVTKLEVVGGAAGVETDILTLRSNFTADNTATTLRFVNSTVGTVNNGTGEISVSRLTNGGWMAFRTANTSPTMLDRMMIDSSGNVGIGTTGPADSLVVQRDTGYASLAIKGTASSGSYLNAYLTMESPNAVRGKGVLLSETDSNRAWFAGVPYNGDVFQIGYASTGSTKESASGPYLMGQAKFCINNAGNVGIGTTAPEGKLTIGASLGSGSNVNSMSGYNLGLHHGKARFSSTETAATNSNYTLLNLLYSEPGNYGGGSINIDFEGRDRGNDATKGVWAQIVGGRKNNTTAAGSGFLSFKTADASATTATERVRIDESGNVGIGSTAPLAKLDVAGAISATGTITGAGVTPGGNVTMGDDAWIGLGASAGRIVFDDAGTDGVNIMNGNVGIGTTAPGSKLTVQSPLNTLAENYALNLYNTGNSLGYGTKIVFSYGASSTHLAGGAIGSVVNTDNNRDLVFYTAGSNQAFGSASDIERVRISGTSGNVGIGTMNPVGGLQIDKTTGSNMYLVRQDASVFLDDLLGRILFDSTDDAVSSVDASAVISAYAAANHGVASKTGYLTFSTKGSSVGEASAATERMRIDTNGNVGIGTTAPSEKLQVSGNVLATILKGTRDQYWLQDSGGQRLGASNSNINVLYTGGASLRVRSQDNSTELVLITETGNVGIGTTAPNAKLEVAGTSTDEIRLYSSGTVNTPKLHFRGSATDSYIYQDSAGSIQFDTEGVATVLTVRNSGNVGIGTTAPNAKLEVNAGVIIAGNAGGENDESEVLRFARYNYPTSFCNRITSSSGSGLATQHRINFDMNDGTQYGMNTVMTLLGNGNVGIGTTGPVHKLQVAVGATEDHYQLRMGTTANYYDIGRNYTDGLLYFYGNQSGYNGYVFGGVDREMVRITNAGNVGIGTTVPGAKLETLNTSAGAVTMPLLLTNAGGSTIGSGVGITFDAFDYVGNTPTGKIVNIRNGSGDYSLTLGTYNNFDTLNVRTGNVGIGTTEPADKLHVYWNDNTWKGAIFENVNTGTSAQTLLQVRNAANLDDSLRFGALGTGFTTQGSYRQDSGVVAAESGLSGGLSLIARNTSGNITFTTGGYVDERMRITSTGNVGIGSTAPGQKLQVTGIVESTSGGFKLPDGTILDAAGDLGTSKWSGTTDIYYTGGNVGIGTAVTTGKLIVKGAGTTTGIGLQTQNSSGTALVTTLDNGNVGIGTTGPVAKLDIFNSNAANTTPLLSIRSDFNTAGDYGMIRFGDRTQTTLYQKGAIIYESVANSARGKLHLALENTDGSGSVALSDARLTVQSDGNVGIGTTTPTAKLHVQGNIKAKMETDVAGNAAIWGGAAAGSVYELGYDIAELFAASEEVELGDVLVIGEGGLLERSAAPYDTRVAGIVSAAPAILFEGSELQMAPVPFSFTKGSKPPLALVGRVVVKVTAEGGPITPGDLLTTSSLPGHAMRAGEYKPGTILGKALEPLEKGEGRIRALVTLQ